MLSILLHMNPEEKQLLQETFRLSQENNQLLRRIRRSLALSNVMSILYYALIIGVPIVLYYYFLQPYVSQLFEYYRNIQGGAEQAQGIAEQLQNNSRLGELLKKFGL